MLTRPFPTITFQSEVPTTVSLPRMDVAAFVGFARQGPLSLPVVVESYLDFVAVFGDRYPLAWDSSANVQQTACLASCVKSFFAQGGRRCWIVRIAQAETAETAVFPLAGVLKTTANSYMPLRGEARYPGSWADQLQGKAELLVKAQSFVPVTVTADVSAAIDLPLVRSQVQFQPLQAGDLLQLDFEDKRHRVYLAVPDDWNPTASSVLSSQKVCWFHRLPSTPTALSGTVQVLGSADLFSGDITLTAAGTGTLQLPFSSVLDATAGDWLSFTTLGKRLWLLVASISQTVDSTTSSKKLSIALSSVWAEGIDLAEHNLAVASIQHVQIVLRSRTTDDDAVRVASLDETVVIGSDSPPGFPLTVALSADEWAIPLGLDTAVPWKPTQVSDEPALVRDGLVPKGKDYTQLTQQDWQAFVAEIFLDPALSRVGQRSLISEASDRLYLRSLPLMGIHSLLPIDEISIIAITDATHAGWKLLQHQETASATVEPEANDAPPDRCDKSNLFQDCQQSEESAEKEVSQLIAPTPSTDWQLMPSVVSESDGLLTVQRAIAQFVAARGDAIAILAMPKDYRETAALRYQQRLLQALRAAGETTDSYVAMYHPWLVGRDSAGGLLHMHPAGSIAGIMASRSLSKGAWVAPANEPIREMLATVSPLNLATEKRLHLVGINPIRLRPQGMVTWSNATLSQDVDLANINVRRLLILLRRLALREGQRYVFSPHSSAFRRRVKQQFEQVLTRLFELGAFSGSRPTEAFQVVIEDALNRQNRVEQGQLTVELRVAPSQPLTFITVRLVQTSDGLTVQEGLFNGG